MISISNTEIEVEDLMRHVGAEVFQSQHSHNRVMLPRMPVFSSELALKDCYTVADFLNYHDEDFIRNAYRRILRREADAYANSYYLSALRNGSLSKLEILGRLRYSPEGRSREVPVSGLLLLRLALQTAYHISALGYLLAFTNFLIRLPKIVKSLQRFEAFVNQQQREQHIQFNALAKQIEDSLNDLLRQSQSKADAVQLTELAAHFKEALAQKADNAGLEELHALTRTINAEKADAVQLTELAAHFKEALAQKADNAGLEELHALTRTINAEKADAVQLTELAAHFKEALAQKADNAGLEELHALTRTINAEKADAVQTAQQILDNKRHIVDQQRRLALFLEEAQKGLPEHISQKKIYNMATEEDRLLDAYYVSFEDRFRGTRNEIMQRAAVYLPIINEVIPESKESIILDIGCGRGEWLELLNENANVARGIDMNRVMVGQCREIGLDVEEAEALVYLRALKPNSLRAVTGFHIIEHIPFLVLVKLFDEALRVLQPGGVAIFETPNPENLNVGACSFYYDPTHIRPLPPIPMKFMLESRGFERVEIMRLQRGAESDHFDEGSEKLRNILNGAFFSPQDYALVGYK